MEEVGHSSGTPFTHVKRWDLSGAPVYGYRRAPGVPPVRVVRPHDPDGVMRRHRHGHDFLVMCLVERGGGTVSIDGQEWMLAEGDLVVLGPGRVVDPVALLDPVLDVWSVCFPPDVIGAAAQGTFLSWRSHPLLFPFVGGVSGGVQRLAVPAAERPAMLARFTALDQELLRRRDGFHDAALAHLTLLLVDVSRLAADVAGSLTLRDEPLLAAVFDAIEAGYTEPLSLKDVAATVGLTPGHLTTVVGRKTGRTVQEWIDERRMAEARRLLTGTGLTIDAVAGRVGFRDASYFIRRFRRSHGVAPLRWRRAHETSA